jgi:hypothetical protein
VHAWDLAPGAGLNQRRGLPPVTLLVVGRLI